MRILRVLVLVAVKETAMPIFCMVLSLMLLSINAHAVTLLDEDYEVATINDLTGKGWTVQNGTDLDSTPVLSIVNCPGGRSGKCLRMQYQGTHIDDNHNAKITKSFTPSPDVWERYYVRYEIINSGQPTGFTDITSKQHYWNVSVLPNMVTNFFFGSDQIATGSQTNTAHLCPNGSVDVTCNLPANLATVHQTYNVWRCIETHAAQASVDMYVDGTQVLHYQGVNWVSPANWDTMQVYRQGADNQYRYEDDFVMATARIGCSATPPDTTPPSAPTGLFISKSH